MKKQKLNLDELKVQSFITDFDKEQNQTEDINGGGWTKITTISTTSTIIPTTQSTVTTVTTVTADDVKYIDDNEFLL